MVTLDTPVETLATPFEVSFWLSCGAPAIPAVATGLPRTADVPFPPNVKVKVVLAACDDVLVFDTLDALAEAEEIPHVQENWEGWPDATADVLDVPLA